MKPVLISAIAATSLMIAPMSLARDNCEVIDEYGYNQLLILTSLSGDQAASLRSIYTTTLAENSINWSISDQPTASGRYPLFVQYYAASARKLRIMFANLELETGNLRGDGTIRGKNPFISSYAIDGTEQSALQQLLGSMLNNDKISVQYEADSMTMNAYAIYHDLVGAYQCMTSQ
ncbi:hypothetical protein [Salinibius halmophilus]|uniref:hypothetical protein n=1 Tax=Salinibius halmophilus TaxID=1853216 RepID=UPI001314AAC7|nr:hypothetical protein [Salinibius halmophilus]